MTDKYRLRQIIIASYLHDMGKLMWRGGYNRDRDLSFTLPTNDVISGTITPFSVAHAQHVLEYILGLGVYEGNQGPKTNQFWQEIAVIAALHHGLDKGTFMEQVHDNLHHAIEIVYHADNISSMERNEDDERNSVKNTPMTSIFEMIFRQQDQRPYTYRPYALSDTNQSINPSEGIENVNFGPLAEGFLAGLDHLMRQGRNFSHTTPLAEIDTRISQCDCLCQEYMTLIPSDAYTSDRADVSLYDHTKLVVANAVVLFYETKQQKINRRQPSHRIISSLPITLIGTDLPSIQAYLDQAMKTTKGLNKRLRARSLMIQMLNEAIIQYILTRLDLPRANILINAGGQGTIISYRIKPEHIEELSDSINRFLIDKFGGYVRAVLASLDTTMNAIYPETNQDPNNTSFKQNNTSFKQTLLKLKEKLSKAKHRLSPGLVECLFNHNNPFRDTGVNPHKWEEKIDDNDTQAFDDLDEGKPNTLITAESDLGKDIVGLDGKTLAIRYQDEKRNFAFQRKPEQTTPSNQIFFLRFNRRWDASNTTSIVVPKSINLFVPKDGDGTVKEFETLANDDYLAYIKGDVDNMSMILGYGFDEDNQYSVSRIVSFARLLEYFFGVKTHRFLEEKFGDYSYTVFSGGDDFELIVKYEKSVDLIQSYTKLFHDFVCHNPCIHFSLGMVLFKHKTPMHLVRKQAESCEKSAKKVGKDEMRKQFELLPPERQEELKNNPNAIRTYEEKRKVLSHRGITLFESQYSFLGSQEYPELRNLGFFSQRFVYEKDFLSKLLTIKGLDHTIGSTFLYNIYTQCVKMKELLDDNTSINFAKYHHLGSQLIYLITRKINDAPEKDKAIYQQTHARIMELLTIDILEQWKEKTQKTLTSYLVAIIYHLYHQRTLNKKAK